MGMFGTSRSPVWLCETCDVVSSCILSDDLDFRILSVRTIANVVFAKVKVNLPASHIFFWNTPIQFEKTVTPVEVTRFGTYAGEAEYEIMTLVITDYYQSVMNTLYVVLVSDRCTKKLVKRRFLP